MTIAVRKARENLAAAKANQTTVKRNFLAAVDAASDAEAARVLVQGAATEAQDAALAGMIDTCNHALAAIFGEHAYTLSARAVAARGKTEVTLSFISPQGHEVDPLTASGGGAVDVAAFALRVAAVLMTRPQARSVMVMDEPFKFLSEDHRPAAAQLLLELADNIGFQFILVTHFPELAVGTVVRLPGPADPQEE